MNGCGAFRLMSVTMTNPVLKRVCESCRKSRQVDGKTMWNSCLSMIIPYWSPNWSETRCMNAWAPFSRVWTVNWPIALRDWPRKLKMRLYLYVQIQNKARPILSVARGYLSDSWNFLWGMSRVSCVLSERWPRAFIQVVCYPSSDWRNASMSLLDEGRYAAVKVWKMCLDHGPTCSGSQS